MKSPKKRSARIWIVAGLLFVPVFYVLSIGPVARWTSERDDSDLSVVWVAYAPIMSMMDVPIIGPGLEFYCQLWMDPEIAWSDVCELAADLPALEFLGLEKSVGVTRVYVGGSAPPRVGIDFDFDVHASLPRASPIQLTSFEAEAKPAGSRFELKIARPPAGPQDPDKPSVFLASADEYTEWLELRSEEPEVTSPPLKARKKTVVIPCPRRDTQPVEPAFTGTAGQLEISEVKPVSPPAEFKGYVHRLRGDIELKSDGGAITLHGDQASISCRSTIPSMSTCEQVQVTILGSARWAGGGFEATADEIRLTLDPAPDGVKSFAQIRDVSFSGKVRFKCLKASGTADQMEIDFDSKAVPSGEELTRIALKGNGVMRISPQPGSSASFEGAKLEYLPKQGRMKADRRE